MKHEFLGIVKEGKVEYDDTADYRSTLATLEGKRVLCSIQIHRRKRSNQQNRYFHGVMLKEMVLAHPGTTAEIWSGYFKNKFLRIVEVLPNGTWIERVKSTTELNTVEMERFLSSCRMDASMEWNTYIPEPNEDYPQQS